MKRFFQTDFFLTVKTTPFSSRAANSRDLVTRPPVRPSTFLSPWRFVIRQFRRGRQSVSNFREFCELRWRGKPDDFTPSISRQNS